MSTFAGILFIALLIWFWLDSARAREIATAICQAACQERDLQFLDQTVAVNRLSVRWTGQGIRIRRVFRFEFSEEGLGRRTGHVILTGINLEDFSLGLPTEPGKVLPFPRRPMN